VSATRRRLGRAAFRVAGLALVLAAALAEGGERVQDNSFLIEEAYNQEPGVVQHILAFDRRAGAWLLTFTQEWPVAGLKHQLSYTLALQNPGDGIGAGVGDAALNYRYQLVVDGGAPVA
jgi:hypothetical protein